MLLGKKIKPQTAAEALCGRRSSSAVSLGGFHVHAWTQQNLRDPSPGRYQTQKHFKVLIKLLQNVDDGVLRQDQESAAPLDSVRIILQIDQKGEGCVVFPLFSEGLCNFFFGEGSVRLVLQKFIKMTTTTGRHITHVEACCLLK